MQHLRGDVRVRILRGIDPELSHFLAGSAMVFDLDLIERLYSRTPGRIRVARRIVGRPLTLTEKILYVHYWRPPKSAGVRGETYTEFAPDRVAMQDATAQMALLQFMSAGIPRVAVPSTVHCDHLILAQ
jgi:aconitate hydratase